MKLSCLYSWVSVILLFICSYSQAQEHLSKTSSLSTNIASIQSNQLDQSQVSLADLANQNHQLGFRENKGQFIDHNGVPVHHVLYKVEQPGLNVWVTTSGLTYQFFKLEEEEERGKNALEKMESNEEPKGKTKEIEWTRVDMTLKGASIKSQNITQEGALQQGDERYFLGHCPKGITGVQTYTKLIIENIYEGIDWILYTSERGTLKHDFVVHPGANPDQIKLVYEGNGQFAVTENQISFQNELGSIFEGQLLCYQNDEATTVQSSYRAIENGTLRYAGIVNKPNLNNAEEVQEGLFSVEVSLDIPSYNAEQDLIIDPELFWGTLYGGNGLDGFVSIDTDNNDNVFVTGYVGSANFPTLNPGGGTFYSGTVNGTSDILIVKFDSNGQRLWATYYGGSASDQGNYLTTDISGNVWIAAQVNSSDLPTLNPGGGAYFDNTINGSSDLAIIKFNNNGQLLWGTFYGGSGFDTGNSIATDVFGNAWVTGLTQSANFPTLNPGGGAYFNGTSSGGRDAYILKFNSSNQQVWATYYGGSADDRGISITTDPTGNAWITGYTASNDLPTLNPGGSTYFDGTANGFDDTFILKFNNAGQQLWATYYGGSFGDQAYTIASDNLGNIWITGYTFSTDFPVFNPGGGAYFDGVIGAFDFDIFVLKFDNSGQQLWASFYGGSNIEIISTGNNIAIDSCNSVYIHFETGSNDNDVLDLGSCHYFDGTLSNNGDLFIVKFNNDCERKWATYLGDAEVDSKSLIAVNTNNDLLVAGEFIDYLVGTGLPLQNPGGSAYFDNTPNGSDDSFILKFDAPNTTTDAQVEPTPCLCDGQATVTVTCGEGPYDYVWSTGDQTLNTTSTSNTITNLCPGSYSVTVTSQCNQEEVTNFTLADFCALPIELLSFEAIAQENETVHLTWTTASERNNDFFTLEKSVDGINFTPFATVPGAGNSEVVLDYEDFDLDPYSGISYYRLKQTDFDGLYTYSDIRTVVFDELIFVNLYPNPTQGQLSLEIGTQHDDEAHLQISDLNGRIVFENDYQANAGVTTIQIDISSFAAGVYTLHVSTSKENYIVKELMKQ